MHTLKLTRKLPWSFGKLEKCRLRVYQKKVFSYHS